jgi:hypothetical protein
MGDEGAAEETIGDPVVGGVNSPTDDGAEHGEDEAASLEGNRGEATGGATCDGGTGAGCSEGSSSSSRRAPRPVPAPWLGNNTGEYAASTNWSDARGVECKGGDEEVDGSAENGNTFSSKMTSREI